jgi:glutathione S-transferase
MIKLHGTTLSNYFSTAKLAFVEKNVPFEEVSIMPSQEPEVLAVSPMGKVPYIEVDGTTLSETNVIFDYLEDIQPQPALYPGDAWAKAKAKEIIRVVELYLDTPARRHLPSVYFGAPVNQTAYKQVRPELEKGLRALKQLARFEPYIAGDSFTFADIAAYFQLRFTNLHTTKIYDWDITDALPGLGAYLDMIGQRPSVKAVDSVMQEALAGFLPK